MITVCEVLSGGESFLLTSLRCALHPETDGVGVIVDDAVWDFYEVR